MPRQIGPHLKLHERIGGEELIEGRKGSKVVVPFPKPRLLSPVGGRIPPCRLSMEPVRRFEYITRFTPKVMSPMPLCH